MAGLRVFISSTCYDFALLRSELRNFITAMGYDPIMSDYADVLFDPRTHTHTSCIDEINSCDMLIVVIGSRFGGKSVPAALQKIDFSAIASLSDGKSTIKTDGPISITQLEVLKAIENNLPVYTFIEKKVYYEHELYEKNKDTPDIVNKIKFPAIEKPETAQYIFSFIDFLRLRSMGNSFFQFERISEIEEILKKQWSGYFQRLLIEQRHNINEHKQTETLDEKFEDLKTAILSSIENVDQRKIAKGIVQFRRLLELLFGIHLSNDALINADDSFQTLLKQANVKEIWNYRDFPSDIGRRISPRVTYLILEDSSFYVLRYPKEVLLSFESDWDSFSKLSHNSKEIILETLREMYRPDAQIRYHEESFAEFLNELSIRFSQTVDE